MKAKVSIVIPVYNAEQYVKTAADSILKQTYENIELILVDDGSTDNSGKLLDELAAKDTRVTAVHTANKGAAAARNKGVRVSTGEWIGFVDSDDTVTADYVEYLMNMAKRENADIAVCGYSKVYDSVPEYNEQEQIISMNGYEAMETLLYQRLFMSVPWGSLQKRYIWDNLAFPEGTGAEDMGTLYKMYAAAGKVIYGSHRNYHYYQRITNTVYSDSNNRNNDYYKHSADMLRYVTDMYPDYKNAAYSRHFSCCFQILSETRRIDKNREMIERVTADIKKCRSIVLKDKKARMRNRLAAFVSYCVGVKMLHLVLNAGYRRKIQKMKA